MVKSSSVKCKLCGVCFRSLMTGHLTAKHKITADQYRSKFPSAKLENGTYAKTVAGRKRAWDAKSLGEKLAFSKKMSVTMKRRFSDLTPEERTSWGERSRESMLKFLSGLSTKEREAYRKRQSDKAKAQDLTKFIRSARRGWKKWYDSQDQKSWDKYRKNLSRAHKKRFASMSEEELREHMMRSFCVGTSKPEARMVRSLKALGYEVVPRYKIGRFEADTYLCKGL